MTGPTNWLARPVIIARPIYSWIDRIRIWIQRMITRSVQLHKMWYEIQRHEISIKNYSTLLSSASAPSLAAPSLAAPSLAAPALLQHTPVPRGWQWTIKVRMLLKQPQRRVLQVVLQLQCARLEPVWLRDIALAAARNVTTAGLSAIAARIPLGAFSRWRAL